MPGISVRLPQINAILLAAGESSRMGQPKSLLSWNGLPLIQYQVNALMQAGLSLVIVVLGHLSERLCPLVKEEPGVRTVINLRYRTGKTSSLLAGLRQLDPQAEHVLVLAVDQPRSPQIVRQVVSAHVDRGSLITYPSYQRKGGHPVIFARALLPEMMRTRESRQGLREVVERHRAEAVRIPIDDPAVLLDLNRPGDYQLAVERE